MKLIQVKRSGKYLKLFNAMNKTIKIEKVFEERRKNGMECS